MFERRSPHLSDERLAGSQTGDLAASEVRHLEFCIDCRRRMDEIRAAAALYAEYRDSIRGPMLPPPPESWASLSLLVARHEAAEPPKRSHRWPVLLIAAACAAMAGTLAYKLAVQPATPVSRPIPHEVLPTPVPPPAVAARETPAVHKPDAEIPIGPEDMLRVFRALDEIGADVAEPLDVSEDAEHRLVVVRAGGLPAQRRQEIADALQPLPKVSLTWDAGSSGRASAHPAASEQVSTNIPDAVRQQLEDRLGGPIARQEVTDRVLEASAAALARAYAVQVLAEKFPPETEARLADSDREVLRGLVQRHLSELDRLAARTRTELKMLLPKSDSFASANPENEMTNWQFGAAALVGAAQASDTLLNRLLAGSYSQAEGDEMLAALGPHIRKLEAAVRAERQGGK
jgi:hypothetical protein